MNLMSGIYLVLLVGSLNTVISIKKRPGTSSNDNWLEILVFRFIFTRAGFFERWYPGILVRSPVFRVVATILRPSHHLRLNTRS